MFRTLLAAVTVAMATVLAACGDDNGSAQDQPAAARSELAPVKDYLLQHTERLKRETAAIRAGAERYHALAEEADFDYAKLLDSRRDEVRRLVADAQKSFQRANPA